MSSLETKAAIQFAVKLCNKYNLKREILCASGSYYEISIKYPVESSPMEVWFQMVEKAAKEEVKLLPGIVRKEVMAAVFPIGLRMLTWAVYHERTVGLSHDFSMDTLDPSCFTQEGPVDKRSVAGKLMEEKSLTVQQKFKLACLYCFEDNVKDLYRKLTPEDIEILLSDSSELTKFWIYYSRGEGDKLRGEKTMDEYRLEKAVESGSKSAVEYSWNIIRSSDSPLKDEYIRNAAIHAVRNSVRHGVSDRAIFHRKFSCDSSVPRTYYLEIIYFLLSEMTEVQKREFLAKDTNTYYTEMLYESTKHSMVLEYSLSWPYQDSFMEMARLMWEFLPENNYAELLLTICDKIGLRKRKDMLHGEETFDYRQLFQEFWKESPKHYKEYVFSNVEVCPENRLIKVKSGTGLLSRLLNLHCYDARDDEAIRFILGEATDAEKENIFSDKALGYTCVELSKEEKFKQLDTLSQCFASIVEEDKFKSEFFRDWRGQLVLSDALKRNKWEAFKKFAEWCALPEEQLKELKKELIKSKSVISAFRDIVLKERKMEVTDGILMWFFSSEEEIQSYKKDLSLSFIGITGYKYFLSQEEVNLIDAFIKWCLSSDEEIKRLKKKVLNQMGRSVCLELFYKSHSEKYADFEGGLCEIVDNFFKWCLLTDQEISAFKRDTIHEELGERIFSHLIKSNLYHEAQNFLDWLNVPSEKIKILKKDTLLKYAHNLMRRAEPCNEVYISMRKSVSVERRSAMQVCWGFDWEGEETELFLKSCLTDKEAVIEFTNEFKEAFASQILPLQEIVRDHLCEMADEHLKDINAQQTGVKRKFETLSP